MGLIELIIGLLIVFWLLGFALAIGGAFIHLLLVLAVILIFARLLGFKV